MTAAPPPPAHLEPYVTALGAEAAIKLFLAFGGTFLHIPRDPKGRSELVKVLGMDGARALAELSDRVHLPRRLPIGKKWIAQVLKSEGWTEAKIATRLHVTNVTVAKYLKPDPRDDERPDPRQSTLF